MGEVFLRRTRKLTRGSLEGTSNLVLLLIVWRECIKRPMQPLELIHLPRLRSRRRLPRRGGMLPRLVLRPGKQRLPPQRKLPLHRLKIRRSKQSNLSYPGIKSGNEKKKKKKKKK